MRQIQRRLAKKAWNLCRDSKSALALVVLLLLASIVLAQGGYRLSWFTVDGGGGISSGGPYTLRGTVGQPDAGVLSGGSYALAGGFWAGTGPMPPVAMIDSIRPSPAIQAQDTIDFNGSGHDTDEGGAYIVTYAWTSSIDGQLSTQEDFAIPASELSAGTHTITFKAQDDEGGWSPEVTAPLIVRSSPAAVHALILVNRERLEVFYGTEEATQVMARLNALAVHPQVKGAVVQVENDPAVAAAYVAWDTDPTSTPNANLVTTAIRNVIGAQWAIYPNLEYLVIVGDDRVIPFHRVPDDGDWGRRVYIGEGWVSRDSTVGAAFYDNMILTDDYYADASPSVPSNPAWDWKGGVVYIPDLGTGRLIETSSEIIAQIDAFLGNDEIAVNNAAVTGYDSAIDAAWAMCDRLQDDSIATECSLIGEQWRRPDFVAQVLNVRHDLVSINGHASHPGFSMPPSDREHPDWPSPAVSSHDIAAATADHTGALFYSTGCLAGLNVPPTNPKEPLDLAQALIQHQANYVANTHLGFGGSETIAHSDELMLNLTRHLAFGQSATPGRALVEAKKQYWLTRQTFSNFDEQVMIESTLYGLPMYRYSTPATTQAQTLETTVFEDRQTTMLGNGLTVNSFSWQFPPLTVESTDDGLYYTLAGLTHVNDGEPIQPKYARDVPFPGTEAHGAVFRSGTYTDITPFDPVVAQAINEYITQVEPSFDAPGWYPTLFQGLNHLEHRHTLIALLGQFNPSTQTERIYDRLSYDVYYHTDSDDWTGPTVSSMQSTLNTGAATVTVWASDSSGIHTVIVAYTDGGGTWGSSELVRSGGSWTGDLAANAETEFFVQVVDGAGNVTAVERDGLYFQPGDAFESEIFLPLVLRDQ